MQKRNAILVLESGLYAQGESFGAPVEKMGEVVFNTSLSGYQEILSDPSYKGQIILMTEPHIGNVGTNTEDMESAACHCEGLAVKEFSRRHSNWRAQQSLQDFLKARGVPAISGLDTRAFTKHIRDVGAMRGILSTTDSNLTRLKKKLSQFPKMDGLDLAKEVTCKSAYDWEVPEWRWGNGKSSVKRAARPFRVVIMDFGIKHNILRSLANRGCSVRVVPAQTTYKEILAQEPDGIMLSNGPGDPAAVTYATQTIQSLISSMEQNGKQIPIFGICLGHQLLGLALGAKTYKLKFGHRGCNHPVKDLATGKIEITVQNHGFAVDPNSLGSDLLATHINLNDNTLEGLTHKKLPVFSVQYHPESSGGPHDSSYLFDRFIDKIKKYRGKRLEQSLI